MPFSNLEATCYLHVGPQAKNAKGSARLIISSGGPDQKGSNCCVYSIGHDVDTGHTYIEEEGSHQPLKISPMPIEYQKIGGRGQRVQNPGAPLLGTTISPPESNGLPGCSVPVETPGQLLGPGGPWDPVGPTGPVAPFAPVGPVCIDNMVWHEMQVSILPSLVEYTF